MALLDVLIPQLGEGLQEVVLLTVSKKPGDFVKRDELLYSMETDKAVMEVESPYEGVLTEWLADEGAVLPIGAPVARIDSEAIAEVSSAAPESVAGTSTVSSTEVQIPPRTRAHARELGIDEDELRRIPAATGKLMPADVDAYVAAKPSPPAPLPESLVPRSGEGGNSGYVDRPLSQQQRLFVHRLKRSAQTVVPATMKLAVDWSPIARLASDLRSKGQKATEFQTFAYCVAQTVKEYPKFRSNLTSDDNVREYAHVNLGVAVARPNDDLVTAVVPRADALTFDDFIAKAQERIHAARDGEDQAGADTHLLLTYMGSFGVVDATPVLVSPAIAVLFIGSTFEQGGKTMANVVMTFDHRLINGVEAARFLHAVVTKAENVEELGNSH